MAGVKYVSSLQKREKKYIINVHNGGSMLDNQIYIFVSHSHKDLYEVRLIRNYLESIGCEPILFFLKSLDDENTIIKLIQDEIDARIWFIYCRSKNAEASKWVKSELDYVAKTGKDNVLEIDLENCLDSNNELSFDTKRQIDKVFRKILLAQGFFISYSRRDAQVASSIMDYLSKYGIKFWSFDNLLVGVDWVSSLVNAIDNHPFFLLLISENSINSKFIRAEYETAFSQNKIIVPVYIKNNGIMESQDYDNILNHFPFLAGLDIFTFDANEIERSSLKLINHILHHYPID